VSGQPGIGKTSLVHVLAGHCGYNVVELNASDDRKVFTDALQVHSVFQQCPNLVLVDEVDALSSDKLVNSLVKIATSKKHLLRPIVLVCNDLYAPVLRQLRPHCQIIQLQPPEYQVVASRLMDICQWEHLQVDLRTILSLVDITRGDLRASLNALQMIKQKYSVVTHADIAGIRASIQMDIVKGWFPLVKEIFHLQTAKEKAIAGFTGFEKSTTEQNIPAKRRYDVEDTPSKRMHNPENTPAKRTYYQNQKPASIPRDQFTSRIASLIRNSGDSQRVMNACFENYLLSPKIDTLGTHSVTESRIVQQCHFLDFYDQLCLKVETTQHFELMSYADYALTSFHGLFATAKHMDIQFPKSEHTHYTQKREYDGIVDSVVQSMDKQTRMQWGSVRTSRQELVMDLFPYMSVISAPEINPVH
jgi:nucleoside-triphosphatase THEP1